MAGTDLKPCPFCGGEAEMLTAESMHGGDLFGIMCQSCCSRGDVYDTEAEAVDAWNTRSAGTCHPVIAITDDGGYEYALCSECDCLIELEDNYCPNCGRKVVSE